MRRWVLPTSKSPSYSTTLTLSSLLTPLRMVQSPPPSCPDLVLLLADSLSQPILQLADAGYGTGEGAKSGGGDIHVGFFAGGERSVGGWPGVRPLSFALTQDGFLNYNAGSRLDSQPARGSGGSISSPRRHFGAGDIVGVGLLLASPHATVATCL